MRKLLVLNQVSYQYEQSGQPVLNQISCTFESGKLYCITGASGAGKSTLLSLIAGLDLPAYGELLYQGQTLAALNRDDYRAKQAGVIFQSCNLLQHASAAENVLLALHIAGGPPILAADEPTGHLDLENEKIVMEIFQRLAHENKQCVIIATHSQNTLRYADEVLSLQQGRLAAPM